MKKLEKLQAHYEGKRSEISIGNIREGNKVEIAILVASQLLGDTTYIDEYEAYLIKFQDKGIKFLEKKPDGTTLDEVIKHLLGKKK